MLPALTPLGSFFPTEILEELKNPEVLLLKEVDYMLCEEVILFSQRRESWPSEAMIAGNKLSVFPFCSATNGTFYQSRPAGKDFCLSFLQFNFILCWTQVHFKYKARTVQLLSICVLLKMGLAFIERYHLLRISLIYGFEDICPLK